MKYDTIEEWVGAVPRDFQRLGHDTGWCECVGDNGYGVETFFTFTTINGRKARRAIELLAAAGLLCESPCGPDDGFHVIQIAGEGGFAGRGQPELAAGRAAVEGLRARNVAGLLELPRVDA